MAGSGLVQDGEAGNGIQQRLGNLRHSLVQRAGPLASAHDQQPGRVFRRPGREREELGAHGNPGDFGIAEITQASEQN